jgi:2-haloacid dehalogenase
MERRNGILQPYPEVRMALGRLKRYQRVILSNGSPVMLETLLNNTGLQTEFDAVLSVDAVKIYKPAPQVYGLALRHLRTTREEIGFLSANGFDVVGAKAFGFTVYWVNRTGTVMDELGIAPVGLPSPSLDVEREGKEWAYRLPP